ncbi:MAG TPA: pyrimidine reductase family protein [Gemmatimonadales bacterium]|nr:pyrimidine reductase family protein [Gemmatimonadales bacterium]
MFDVEDLVSRYAVADRTVPHLRVNFIASIDGAASHNGVSGPLNNEVDKEVFDVLRMLTDVVLVGAGTIRAEGYGPMRLSRQAVEWRVAHGLPEHPVLAILTSEVDLDPASPLFADAPVWPIIVTHGHGPEGSRRRHQLDVLRHSCHVMVCGEDAVDPHLMVSGLVARGLPQILSEGGPHALGSLIAADVVDEMCLTIAPVLEGGDATRVTAGGPQTTREMHLAHAVPAGDMLFLRYLRARPTTARE